VEGARGSGLQLRRLWQWRQQPTVASARAGNGGQSRGSTRADNNQQKSGSNGSRNGSFDGGDGSNVAVAAAMVTAAMVATTRQPWQR